MTPDPDGVWIVASTSWTTEGPGHAIPYRTAVDALTAANEATDSRAYFVPWGTDLHDVMWPAARQTTE